MIALYSIKDHRKAEYKYIKLLLYIIVLYKISS